MKKFVYYETEKSKSKLYGYRKITCHVYRVEKNKELTHIGNCDYCTASTYGNNTEVMHMLMEKNEISKNIVKKYCDPFNEHKKADYCYFTKNPSFDIEQLYW